MKRASLVLLFVGLMGMIFTSCSDDDSYAEQRKTERRQIQSFISKGCLVMSTDGQDTILYVPPVKTISGEEFEKDTVTNVEENEYVLFSKNGVYMQIVRRGVGDMLTDGKSATILCRYYEFNIAGDTLQTTNRIVDYEQVPETMTVSNSLGVFSASFTSGLMKTVYGSTTVPEAWLYPLYYIRLGRQNTPDGEIAKVRLIVPSDKGQTDASTNIYPTFYEITYMRGR